MLVSCISTDYKSRYAHNSYIASDLIRSISFNQLYTSLTNIEVLQ